MTAEIALLNKSAVALAADSAMTIRGTGKIYPVDKLFALSKRRPVGVMVYNNAEFMGVPWETIIKMYRVHAEKKARSTCEEYFNDFVKFIRTPPFCTPEQISANMQLIALDAYRQIFGQVASGIQDEALQLKRGLSRQAWNRITKTVVEQHLAALETLRESNSTKEINEKNLIAAHRDNLDELISKIFRPFELTQSNRKALHRVFQITIKSNALSNNRSGIVVAGFGEDELFPTLWTLETDGVVDKFLKHSSPRDINISRDRNSAVIKPFAQQEMVRRFMEGIDPEFLAYFRDLFLEQLFLFGKGILEAHGLANDERLTKIRNVAELNASSFFEKARNFQNDRFILPIMEIVRHLPKEELGSMAEALVSLTSLKRRVSYEQETVGGPVDVAVISKGDGFIWVRRKHYFDPALNLHYVENQSKTIAKGEQA